MKNKKLRIGLDFDNTIICYDQVFFKLAVDLGFIKSEKPLDKVQVKEYLLKKDGDDLRWQKLQSLAYSDDILAAKAFAFATQVIERFKELGHEVFIVSHKTEVSNFDSSKDLHQAAWKWIEANKLAIPKAHINFCPTLEEKVAKIASLDLDIYLDDLEKVLTHETWTFPTTKVHFCPRSQTFRSSGQKIKIQNWQQFLGVVLFSQDDRLEEIAPIRWQGNNSILQLEGDKKAILKSYLVDSSDLRPRAKTEVEAFLLLEENKLAHVPKIYAYEKDFSLALMEFIEGENPTLPQHLEQIHEFTETTLHGLKKYYQIHTLEYPEGSDSRTCLQDYFEIVKRRKSSILENLVDSRMGREIADFINDQLHSFELELYQVIDQKIAESKIDRDKLFHRSQRLLSPSDFGPHNLILGLKEITLLDLEYFGADDAVKFLADLFHHAAFDYPEYQYSMLLGSYRKEFPEDQNFVQRFSIGADLIGLEWIYIMLNVASQSTLERKLFANPQIDPDELLRTRLRNASRRLEGYKEIAKIRNKENFWNLLTIPSDAVKGLL